MEDPALSYSKRDMRFLEIAYSEALKAHDAQHKLGAVLVKGGSVIAKGYNSYTNLRHAEVSCLSKVWESERKGAVLYVVRTRKTQKFGMSKPCPKCENFIKNSGIKKVIYTTNDNTIESFQL